VRADGTIPLRELWAETARVVGDRHRARWLCETAAGCDGAEFLESLDDPVTERMVAHLDAMLARLRDGEPLQYVLGSWGFRRLSLLVDRRVLIPRPETETVVDHALAALRARPRPWRVADLGTGSGAIGLAIADEVWHDGLQVWLTDASADALDVARANLAGVGRAASAVRVAQGSWYEALPSDLGGSFDLIVSNPPYIAVDDDRVEPIVREWEPGGALFAADEGLAAVREIVAGATTWLAPGGTLVVEIGTDQRVVALAAANSAGLIDSRIERDPAGHDRVLVARRAA
jgi:release factor glutamine methyltransferase